MQNIPDSAESKTAKPGARILRAFVGALLGILVLAAVALGLALSGGPKPSDVALPAVSLNVNKLGQEALSPGSAGAILVDGQALKALALGALSGSEDYLKVTRLDIATGADSLGMEVRAVLRLPTSLPLGLYAKGLPFRAKVGLRITGQKGVLSIQPQALSLGYLPLPPRVAYRKALGYLAGMELPKGIKANPEGIEVDTETLLKSALPGLGGKVEVRGFALDSLGLTLRVGLSGSLLAHLGPKAVAVAKALPKAARELAMAGQGAAALSSSLAAAAPSLEALAQGEVVGQLQFCEGRVEAASLGTPRALEIGDLLHKGDTVVTGPSSKAEIRLGNGVALSLAPDTTLVLASLGSEALGGGQRTLKLLAGGLRAKVAKLVGSSSFEIMAASTVAGVRGTDFVLSFVEGDVLSCSVLEGQVALDSGAAGMAQIPAGKRAYVTATKGQSAVEALPQGEGEGLEKGFAFAAPDPLATPFDLSVAIMGMAPHWAKLWFAMSPAEQAQVQAILLDLPELRALAREVGIEL